MSVSNDNSRVMITLSKETKEILKQIAKKEQRSMSNMCVKIINDFITIYINNEGENKNEICNI